jgi:hypothetical protein
MARMVCVALLSALVFAASAAPATSATLVTFHKTGGIAGVDQRLTVRTDGRATVSGRSGPTRHRQLRAATMRRLRSRLAAAHLERPLPPPPGCADCFEFAISYHGHHVKLVDAGNLPARVGPLVAELTRVADGGR